MTGVQTCALPIYEKLWSESPPNSQSCSDIGTDPQCFKYYNGVFNKTQEIGRKENNPLPSKEDNWFIRDRMYSDMIYRVMIEKSVLFIW